MCDQDFVQKGAAEHQERVAASAKPATTRLALVPLSYTRHRLAYCRHPAGSRGRAGDLEGVAVWNMILKAIKELLDKTPPGDQSAVH